MHFIEYVDSVTVLNELEQWLCTLVVSELEQHHMYCT